MSEVTSTMAGADDEKVLERETGLVLVAAANPEASPRAFVLRGASHLIGREPGPGGFTLTQSAVSRVHAVVQRHADGVRIRDMGSRNGTWVNGERIEECALVAGSDVRIGDAVFVFVEHDAAAHLAYGLDGSLAADAAPIAIDGVAGGLSMARLSAAVQDAARSNGSTLVFGETGTGKELVAHGIHDAAGRAGAFVPVNCAAISPHLVESELFGYAKGAFSGAVRDHEGLIRAAHGGTLFLDEVGDLPLEAQAKLLRALEAREVMPVGSTRTVPVDLRVVCATHRDLLAHVHAGAFRADLYARIAGTTILVPPLRERKEDLFLLVRHILARVGHPDVIPTFPFMARLVRHDWPFNVRELTNLVQRIAPLAQERELRPAHLPKDFGDRTPRTQRATLPPGAPSTPPPPEGPAPRRKAPSAEAVEALLVEHRGNVAAIARVLACDPAQIYRWLKRYDLDPDRFR